MSKEDGERAGWPHLAARPPLRQEANLQRGHGAERAGAGGGSREVRPQSELLSSAHAPDDTPRQSARSFPAETHQSCLLPHVFLSKR